MLSLIFSLAIFAGASASVLPQLTPRNTVEMEFTFWRDGCEDYDCGNELGCGDTYTFGPGFQAQTEQCYNAPDQSYHTGQIATFDSTGWTVDLFTGYGCTNFLKTVSGDTCFSQPEGQIIAGMIAHHSG